MNAGTCRLLADTLTKPEGQGELTKNQISFYFSLLLLFQFKIVISVSGSVVFLLFSYP